MLTVGLSSAPIDCDYVDKECGPENSHCTQNGFISELLLPSETPLYT